MINKGSAVFKYKPEDLMVEEKWGDYICKVSENVNAFENNNVGFGEFDTEDRKAFLTMELEKINIDHFSMLNTISKELKNYAYEIGYAGTKDKNAWTCQRISIYNAKIEKIRKFSFPGIILKKFKWAKHKIKIGDLTGNKLNRIYPAACCGWAL